MTLNIPSLNKSPLKKKKNDEMRRLLAENMESWRIANFVVYQIVWLSATAFMSENCSHLSGQITN